MSARDSFALMAITCVAGLVLSIVPLPHWLAILRPGFLVLVVLYWSTMAPRAGGILLGFICGLALDVFQVACWASMRWRCRCSPTSRSACTC